MVPNPGVGGLHVSSISTGTFKEDKIDKDI